MDPVQHSAQEEARAILRAIASLPRPTRRNSSTSKRTRHPSPYPDLLNHHLSQAVSQDQCDSSLIRSLISAGADVNYKDRATGSSPLLLASHKGHTQAVEELLAAGAHVNHTDMEGSTALHMAIEGNHENCIRVLINAGGIGNVGERYETPLMLVSRRGYVNVCRELVGKGTRVDTWEGSAALLAAARGDHTEVIELLVAAGADVNYMENLDTALTVAATGGFRASMQALLKSGANVNHAGPAGRSALMLASARGERECVQALLTAGANVNQTSATGDTVLMHAIHHIECLQLLIGAGADVNQSNAFFREQTALWKAALNWTEPRPSPAVTCLIHAGADIQATRGLFRAVYNNSLGTMRLVLYHGARVENIAWCPWRLNLSVSVQKWRDMAFAAGAEVEGYPGPDEGKQGCLDLMQECRKVIRRHLLGLNDVNLFYRVVQLPLPALIQKYLVFGHSLMEEEDHSSIQQDLIKCQRN